MKKNKRVTKKGFTLIELLIVIAIIAILSVVVVLTLNPAEMLRRSRDSNRASDLSVIKTAIGLYLADVSSTSMGTAGTCYLEYSGATAPTSVYEFASNTVETAALGGPYALNAVAGCGQWFGSTSIASSVVLSSRSVNSTSGWIPINLSLVSSGAPIGQWPTDPAYSAGVACASNCNASAGHFYSYIYSSTNNAYKLAAKMESSMYSQAGTNDLESTDGGSDPDMYEQGTNLAL